MHLSPLLHQLLVHHRAGDISDHDQLVGATADAHSNVGQSDILFRQLINVSVSKVIRSLWDNLEN